MFTYNVCNVADEQIFTKQCEALERKIRPLEKKDLLVDVDNTKIQRYYFDKKEIKVINSYYVNAVYIESELQLENFFK